MNNGASNKPGEGDAGAPLSDAQPPESAAPSTDPIGERREDWDEETEPEDEPFVVKTEEVSGKDLLAFAERVLVGLAILAILLPSIGFAAPIIVNQVWPVGACHAQTVCTQEVDDAIRMGESLMDLARTAIPSLATLVIGFYFGQKLK